jgi:hypothetical protein
LYPPCKSGRNVDFYPLLDEEFDKLTVGLADAFKDVVPETGMARRGGSEIFSP